MSVTGKFKLGRGGKQARTYKKIVQVANQKMPTHATTQKASLGNLKNEDVGLARPIVAEVAAMFAQHIRVQHEDGRR